MKVGPRAILTRKAHSLAGEVGCLREQALPCMEGATGLSRRIFPKKKKTLWGTLGSSPAATAPVSSPPHHPLGDCAHLISEGAETTGTTRGRVPSNRECAYPPGSPRNSSRRELRLQASPGEGSQSPGGARTSFQKELRLQAPPRAGCPVSGSVPSYLEVHAPHLRGS